MTVKLTAGQLVSMLSGRLLTDFESLHAGIEAVAGVPVMTHSLGRVMKSIWTSVHAQTMPTSTAIDEFFLERRSVEDMQRFTEDLAAHCDCYEVESVSCKIDGALPLPKGKRIIAVVTP